MDLVLDEIPIDAKRILEVGCGSGIFGFILKKTRTAVILGVEPFEYELGHYDYIYDMTWTEWFEKTSISEKSFDVIVCNETIEHMEKRDALRFLDEVKTRANKIIIGTPYKWDQQEAYDNNSYQVHKCVISKEEFEDHGYDVKQVGVNLKNGIRMYSKSTRYSKVLNINPTNLIAIYQTRLRTN